MRGNLSFFDVRYDRRILWRCPTSSFVPAVTRLKFSGASLRGISAKPEGGEFRVLCTFEINGRFCLLSTLTVDGRLYSLAPYFDVAELIESEMSSVFAIKFDRYEKGGKS